MKVQLLLASQSPRRKDLLKQLGYQFNCLPADIDESLLTDETPINYVKRLAIAKAQHIYNITIFKNKNSQTIPSDQSLSNEKEGKIIVLGSDTTVVINEKILTKPTDLEDCIAILTQLSGKKHQVLTAISATNGIKTLSEVVTTDVYFKPLTVDEIIRYWHTGEPQDKAGAYGIQGIAGQFVTHIEGSYSAVVGLPLYQTVQLLTQFNVLNTLQLTSQHS